MGGELAIIDRIIAMHRHIRQDFERVPTFINDYEAFFSLQQAQARLAQSAIGDLEERKARMLAVLKGVRTGLTTHFSFEESALPPLLGEVLTKALKLEHDDIKQHMEKAVSLAETLALDASDRAGALDRKSILQEEASSLGDRFERHARMEEQVLAMLRRAFTDTAAA